MSIFKTNKFFRVIKHFILALPLMFVLGTSLYAIVNPNAKDSYYGENINDAYYEDITSLNVLETNKTYRLDLVSPYAQVSFMGSNTNRIVVDNVKVITTTLTQDFSDLTSLSFTFASNTSYRVYFYDSDNVEITNLSNTQGVFIADFTYLSNNLSSTNILNFAYVLQSVTYNEYSYLNNAFEYGMYQFTQIGFGQFDFISYFNGIFTTNINNVYASFINDYINYYLFVECVYFAPWVLHAFIHFIYDMADLFRGRFNKTKEDD